MSKFISIDLDPQGIFAISGTSRAGHVKVEFAVAWDGTDGEPPGTLTTENAKQLGAQLQERLKSVGASPAPVLVSIPRDRVILKEIRYPAVPPTEEPHVVRFQAMKELTDAPEDVVIDYIPVSTNADGERRSMVFAVRKEFFNSIQSLCTSAGLRLAAITPRPFGVAAGLTHAFRSGLLTAPEGKPPVAVLTLSPGGGEFTVMRAGSTSVSSEVTFTRTIASPSMASENMLLAEVRRNLTMYAGANPGHPIEALYVADADGRTTNRLRNSLGISVHAYNPLAGVTTTVPESSQGRFAAAVGLLAANSGAELPINFVVPRQPKVEKNPYTKQLLLIGLCMFLFVGACLGAGMYLVTKKEEEAAKLQDDKTELEERAKTLEPDDKRYQATVQWKHRQVVWLDMLYDLTDQFRHSDDMVVISFNAKALPVDMKTGKQDAQATIDIKLTSHSPAPVNALISAMESDRGVQKSAKEPPRRFYTDISRPSGGAPSGDPNAREYVVHARVLYRTPEEFTRVAQFIPPSRKNYPPPPKERDGGKGRDTNTKDKDGKDNKPPQIDTFEDE